ncbi:MAG TPA: hypothetical protein VFF67_09310 [Thermoplasmata archaeon]|nr:hypothetical protein [Thermoplasmata archaeon]
MESSRSRVERPGRWTRTLPWTAGVAVVLLLLPGSVAASTTIKAPFKTAGVKLTNPTTTSGCGFGSAITPAAFNRTTGVGGFADNASATWCTNATSNSASRTGQIVVSLPFKVASNGKYNITAIWVTVAVGFVNLTAGKCTGSSGTLYSSCTRSAKAYVYGTAYIADKTVPKKTKPSNVWPGNFTYVSNYTSCTYTACSSKASAQASAQMSTGSAFWQWVWTAAPLNATHKYVLVMTIFGGASVVLSVNGASLSGASANAHLNTATLGQDEQLSSVTIG